MGESHGVRRWLNEQVDLLLEEGKSLELVIISVRDASPNADWRSKSGVLVPLKNLEGRVHFRLGDIIVAEGEEEEARDVLETYLETLNIS